MAYIFKLFKSGWGDISAAVRKYELAGVLGWQDIRQRYRRSTLGPFWITISVAIMVSALGLVFGSILGMQMRDFLPYLSIGLILWWLIIGILNEGGGGFTAAESMIKEISLPLFTHLLRVIWRNLIIFTHNLVIFPFVLILFSIPLQIEAVLAVPGLILLMINLCWMALLLSVVCTRYRDVPQIISNILQVFFYLTPILWKPEHLPPARANIFLIQFNPFFHLIEIVRAPLLGTPPSALNWQICAALAVAGWSFTIIFYGRFRSRIAYWL